MKKAGSDVSYKDITLPQLLAVATMGIAALALIGWQTHLRVLAGQWRSYIPMAPSTALIFLLLAGVLFALTRLPARRMNRLFALIAAVLGFLLSVLALVQFFTGIDLGVEEALSHTNELLGSTPVGRMSPLTAASFLLESVAFLMLLMVARLHKMSAAALLCVTSAIFINAVVLVGYIYGVPLLYGGTMVPVAFPTAIAFILLGVGQLHLIAPHVPVLEEWNGGSIRGILLRAFLPMMLLVIFFEGWLDVKLEGVFTLNPALLNSLMALATGVLIVLITGWIAQRAGREIVHAQEALAESEERYRLLYENSGEAILFTQPEGIILSANPEACRIFGRSENEIKRLGRDGLVDMRDARLQAALEERKKTGQFRGELNFLRNDGTTFPGDVISRIYKDSHGNEKTGMFIRDVTRRKQAEAALRESEEKLRTTFSILPVGVTVLDGQQKIVEVNPTLEKIMGADKDALNSGCYRTWKFLRPDGTAMPGTEFASFIATQERRAVFNVEMGVAKEREDMRWINVCAAPLPDGGVVVVTLDITERKRAERVQAHMSEELQRKNDELQNVLLAASHDLRTPLLNIQGFSRRLETIYAKVLPIVERSMSDAEQQTITPLIHDEIPKALRFILVNVEKMDTLIGGLLRLSRLGHVVLRPASLDVEKIVKQSLTGLTSQLQAAAGSVEIGTLPGCYGDAGLIGQIFSNLLDNAIKYRAPDRPVHVVVSGHLEGDHAVYCVADNGLGLAVDDQEKIWDLFHRVNPQGTPGEGLGLNLVRRIVERHQGRIWVESTLGEGSRFFVKLPLYERPASQKKT